MKTSIFNMTFTLPPLIEMTQVEKDMGWTHGWLRNVSLCACY
jgi:hypothetical protein